MTPEQVKLIIGGEATMWLEHAPQEKVDMQLWPRLCAMAELLWTAGEKRDYDGFASRMRTHEQRLESAGVDYFRKSR
jgi:N-acetyl-beta-hexosaminidase